MLIDIKDSCRPDRNISLFDRKSTVQDMIDASEQAVIDKINELETVQKMIPELSNVDFFWLIKKIGDDDCYPLLKYASTEQWEYIFDLEAWRQDRIDIQQVSAWLEKLNYADPARLAEWMNSDGQVLSYFYFMKSIQVEIRNPDDDSFVPSPGFHSLDGVFYFKSIDPYRDHLPDVLLKNIAAADNSLFQDILTGISGIIPSEMEERMYRIKNVRLAEYGFLPREEAIEIYAYLKPNAEISEYASLSASEFDSDFLEKAPVIPFHQSKGQNMLSLVMLENEDTDFFDRLNLEFAGVCNQIISADGIIPENLDTLIEISRKAGGYINIALQNNFSNNVQAADQFLRMNSLVHTFRMGYSLALELKWNSEKWYKNSWFGNQDLDFIFWGETWGESLRGFLRNKPGFYVGFKEEDDENGIAGKMYREFHRLSELDACKKILKRIMILDRLFSALTEKYPFCDDFANNQNLTFHVLLFNLWAKGVLNMPPAFSGLSIEQARELFRMLRSGEKKSPYQMPEFREPFIEDYMGILPDLNAEESEILKDTLSIIWQEFREEYEWLSEEDLDEKYSVFLWIK